MTRQAPEFDPLGLLAALESHNVVYVLIGGFAGTVHGSPLRTGDADICPYRSRPNLERLASALSDLGARIRTTDDPEGVSLPFDASFLEETVILNLVTSQGWLNISFQPPGTRGFKDLRRDAQRFDLDDDLTVLVASLADVIRNKEAAGREKDRAALPTLRRLLEMQDRT